MNTIKLYRPVGLKELELIIESDFKAFPPRLEWQPIFYPVMNEDYAVEIALRWNAIDEFSGYCGFVTAFDVNKEYCAKYEIQNVGGKIHNELWVPSRELEEFNDNIQGKIQVAKTFLGEQFVTPESNIVNGIIKRTKVK